jgi:hypothetical protein
MGALHPIVALLRPYILRLAGFQAGLLSLQEKIVYILAYLPRSDTAVISNGKSGCVTGNSRKHFGVANPWKLLLTYLYVTKFCVKNQIIIMDT